MRKILEYLLIFNLIFLQSYLIRFKIVFYPTNLQEILIAITYIPFLILIFQKKIKIKIPKIAISFFILFISASILVPIYDKEFFFRYWKFLIFATALIFLFINTFQKNTEKEKAITFLSIGASIFGVFSIIYNLSGFNNTFDYRLIGPLDSAVYLAVYTAPLFIFNIVKFTETLKKPYYKNKYGILSLILGIVLLLTKSMGAIVAVSAVVFIFLIKKFGKNLFNSKLKKAILAIFFICLSSVVFYTKILPTIQTTWSSLDERNEIYITAKYILKEPKNAILGVGLGQFQYHYAENVEKAINNKALDKNVLQPHNIYLLFIFNFGILGAFFLTALIFYTIRSIFYEKTSSYKLIMALLISYFLIHGILDTPFIKNDLFFLFLLFLEEEFSTLSLKSSN